MNLGIKKAKKEWDVVQYPDTEYSVTGVASRGKPKLVNHFKTFEEADAYVESLRVQKNFTTRQTIMIPSRTKRIKG